MSAIRKKPEQHFSDEQWSDYVRGLTLPGGKDDIHRHVETGCTECTAARQFWSAFYEVGTRAFAVRVPKELVRTAHASFAQWALRTGRKPFTVARLIFDNALQSASAGVRGTGPSPRRLMSRAGKWVIDLQLQAVGGNQLIITGQVVNNSRAAQAVSAVAVTLMHGHAVQSTGSTNEFGEFRIAGESASGLRLYIDVPGRTAIQVPLPGDNDPIRGAKP